MSALQEKKIPSYSCLPLFTFSFFFKANIFLPVSWAQFNVMASVIEHDITNECNLNLPDQRTTVKIAF